MTARPNATRYYAHQADMDKVATTMQQLVGCVEQLVECITVIKSLADAPARSLDVECMKSLCSSVGEAAGTCMREVEGELRAEIEVLRGQVATLRGDLGG